MSPEVLAATIGGVSTIVAAFLGAYAKEWIDNRDLIRDRVTALKGDWIGAIDQDSGPNGQPLSYGVTCRISSARPKVIGTLRSSPIPGVIDREREFSIAGGFLNDRYLRFEYKDINPEVVQFGSMILEADPRLKSLSGRFIGYGAYSKRLISGTITLGR